MSQVNEQSRHTGPAHGGAYVVTVTMVRGRGLMPKVERVGALVRCEVCDSPIGKRTRDEFIVRVSRGKGRSQEVRVRRADGLSVSCESGHLNLLTVSESNLE